MKQAPVPVGVETDDRVLIGNKAIVGHSGGFQVVTYGKGVKLYARGGKKVILTSGDANIDDGQWHHMAVSFSHSAGTVSLFVDGELISQADINGIYRPFEPEQYDSVVHGTLNKYEFSIGNTTGSSPEHGFIGEIDDVRMYRTALTPQAISTIINNPQ